MRKFVLSCIAVVCSVLMVLSAGAASAERRVALVIGNSQYKNPQLVLFNPKNDAEDVAAVLRTLGFEVILKVDSDKRDFDLAMAQFARLATAADAALFYYAGHALQYQGRNYLMPTDAELEDEISLRYQMVWLDDIRAALERANGVRIMILDACRNNPIVDGLKRKITGVTRDVGTAVRGLAPFDKAQGILVAYATASDEVAADGAGRNSPFTAAFLKHLQEPGLEIATMFRRVAADVNEETNGRQRPELYISLVNEFFLNQNDRPVWERIKDSADPAAFRDFADRFPSSPRASDAKYRLQMIERLIHERQLEQERMEREAAQRRQEEERARLAAIEAERMEREAAQRRQEEEKRARLAAIERERLEREAAQRRQEEERAMLGAIERERLEREAAQRRQEEERARLAAIERERLEREAAQRRQEEERARLAAIQRERLEREAAQRRQDEEQRAKLAAIERERSEREAARQSTQGSQNGDQQARAGAEGQKQLGAAPAPPPVPQRTISQPTPVMQAEACKRDEERLARLRVSPVYDEVLRLERELGCERLRPQLLRLRESISAASERGERQGARQSAQRSQDEGQRTKAEAERQKQLDVALAPPPTIPQPAPMMPAQDCKRDEERLARVRASRAYDELIRFERELGCERLRPQLLRLRESISADGEREGAQQPRTEHQRPKANAEPQRQERGVLVQVPPLSVPLAQICKRDQERLEQLRASQMLDEVIRFERELGCEKLRPQVVRLRESLGAN